MTCRKCIHYEVCMHLIVPEDEELVKCSHYKAKHNFAEVVRCKDCKYRRKTLHRSYCLPTFGLKQITDVNASCSYGVRKEQENIDERQNS